MNKPNKIILLLAFTLVSTGMKAQDRNVNVRYLDGTAHLTRMSEIDRIEIGKNLVRVVPRNGIPSEHAIASIDRIVLDDKTPTGIAATRTDGSSLRLAVTATGLRLSGVSEGTAVEMFNAAGQLTARATCRKGEALIGTSGMPAGMYIVKVGETAYKVVIK